jgi:hypothetical protein
LVLRVLPSPLHRVIAWKRQAQPVDLATSGGHLVGLPRPAALPERFRLLHYSLPSPEHAERKVRAQDLRWGRGSRRLARLARHADSRSDHAAVAGRAPHHAHRRRSRRVLATRHAWLFWSDR